MVISKIEDNQDTNFYNIFVGSETGLLKGINTEKKCWKNINSQTQLSRERSIECLSWAAPSQKIMALALRDQTVQLYDRDVCGVVEEHNLAAGSLVGVEYYNKRYTTCTDKGAVKVWKSKNDVIKEFTVGENVCKMRGNPQENNLIATGGKQNDLKIWDIESETSGSIFKAKNVRHDWLQLEVPIWIKDFQFIPSTSTVVTCTAHHQIRLYDYRCQQRRPTIDISFDEYPLTAISICPNNYQVVSGNSHGTMGLFDLRGKGHMVHKFKDCAGGIKSIVCHPEKDLVASCGLDRYLRVHDIQSKKLQSKFYLKSQLNSMLFAREFTYAEMLSDIDVKQEVMDVDEATNDVEQPTKEKKKSTKRSKQEVEDDKLWAQIQAPKRRSADVTNKKSKKKKTKNNPESLENPSVTIEDTADISTASKPTSCTPSKKIKKSTSNDSTPKTAKRSKTNKSFNSNKKRKLKE